MDGITDAAMRAFQGQIGAFSYAVSEFVRVSIEPIPARVFRRDAPEVENGGKTTTGLPVQVQILGGDPENMALSALQAVKAGAPAIDLNFGCPAPTVNRNDGGATLLKTPCRIRDVVRAVRDAVPADIPVSAKMRLGWDSIDPIDENAAMAAEGGADWITIHARTRTQGYQPPVFWEAIGRVRRALDLPVIANGDIWSLDDFLRCQEITQCRHFMIGRAALASPNLSHEIAMELGLRPRAALPTVEWPPLLGDYVGFLEAFGGGTGRGALMRLKQWANLAAKHGDLKGWDELKRAETLEGFFELLEAHTSQVHAKPA